MWNTVSSITFQVTTVLCGFILPRLILQSYGSEVNGLVSSVQQFLQIIAFMELGVGAVVKSSLYKPLAENDTIKISEIMASANKFFKKLALILVVYVIGLIVFYPMISNQSFDWWYSALLIAAMSISSFAQYYFGIINQLLLTADQKGYVQYIIQIVTLVVNTLACAVLIKMGSSIQMVKLTTSLIYLVRPLVLKLYVDRRYKIIKNIKYEGEPIKQKWNGVAQHVTAVVLDSTDSVVLTLFATLSDVSIYYVYHMVVYGVKQLFSVTANGIQSALGELWAKKKYDELQEMFGWVEWSIHTAVTFLFTCTGLLIVPFVSVYTKGIDDINYIVPVFAILITMANAAHCLRMPVVTVKAFGLVGVAIGTLIGMAYQTIWMALYVSKKIIQWPIKTFIKQSLIDMATVIVIVVVTRWLPLRMESYFIWLVYSILVCLVAALVVLVMNFVLNKMYVCKLKYKVLKR